ncbi:MAG: hypothetical protein ACI81L_000263 [Verrucomicrobiales bacterium]|jgi:hypothetical protein
MRQECPSMGSPRYVETIEAVEAIRDRCRTDAMTPDQFASQVTDVFYDYLIDEDPRDDVVGLVDYCVQVATEVCEISLFADRVLPQRLDNQLRWILEQQGDGHNLAHLIRVLRARLTEGDELAKIELVELCQTGYDSHQGMFSAVDSERNLIALAHEFRVVPALDAAVRPTAPGRLASEEKSRGVALPRTLDLLAHLASDPVHPSGTLARDSLVGLCSYAETAGMAGLRLPVHLLSEDQRLRLHEIYVQHEEALGPQVVRIFITDEQLRDREILRSALWQANDVARMASADDHTSTP